MMLGVACQMAQTWWLRNLVDLDRDGILHPIHQPLLRGLQMLPKPTSIAP